jgi:hypothetical protein
MLLTVLNGCQSWSGRYDALHELKSPAAYPFRFQIKEIRLEAEHFRSEKENARLGKALRSNLLKNYPQFFSSSSRGTVPLTFTMKRLGNKAVQTEPSRGKGGALLTLGLIPVEDFYKREWLITAEVPQQKSENKLVLKLKYSTVILPLGLLLQTHLWSDPIQDGHLSSWKSYGFIRTDSEYLWKFFLDAIARFDRNALQKYYFSTQSSQMYLME